MPDQEDKRVNVIFSPQQYETLEKIAKAQNISISQALRQAINISDLIVSADQDPNSRVLVERNGKTQELKLVG
jgi:hypothetical protein